MTPPFSMTAAAQNPLMAVSAGLNAASGASRSASTGKSPNFGLTMRFTVTLGGDDHTDLGRWTSCTGLGVTFKHETYDAGGMYDVPVVLPGRIEYSDVTLERPITSDSNATVMQWLQNVRDQWVYGTPGQYKREPVTITMYGVLVSDNSAAPVATWTLVNALPVSWTGPTLSADSSKVATEKLVLRHEGFLPGSGS